LKRGPVEELDPVEEFDRFQCDILQVDIFEVDIFQINVSLLFCFQEMDATNLTLIN
jgi:hypothetical protein